MNNNEYSRLLQLKNLIDSNNANVEQKKEYMTILYQNGNITQEQYNNFLSNQNSEEIVKAGLKIGGFILAVWLLLKLAEK
jgi:hypothetical protein